MIVDMIINMLQRLVSKKDFPNEKYHHFARQSKTQKCKHVNFDILAKPTFETLQNDFIDLKKDVNYCYEVYKQ